MTLKEEFEHYLANTDDFFEKYQGRFIVLKNKQVIGVYDNRRTAIEETAKSHPLGTFLVQEVSGASQHARFHSRVSL